MLKQFRLQLAAGKKRGYFYFDFVKDGINYVFTKESQLIEKSKMTPSDEIMVWTLISDQKPYIDIKYNEKEDKGHSKTWSEIIELIKNYHNGTRYVMDVNDNGYVYSNKAVPNHIFDLINETQIRMQNYKTLKQWGIAWNILNSMSYEEKRDLMYHFGHDPNGMTHSELTMLLGEPKVGIVMQRTQYDTVRKRLPVSNKIASGFKEVEVPRSYLEYFVEKFSGQIEKQTTCLTMVRKAMRITLPEGRTIIEKRNDGLLYFYEIAVGTTIEEAAGYFYTNVKNYELLVEKVQKYDLVNDNDDDEQRMLNAVNIIEKKTEVELSHYQSMLKEMRTKYKYADIDPEITQRKLADLITQARKVEIQGNEMGLGNLFKDDKYKDLHYTQIKKLFDQRRDELKAAKVAKEAV